MPMNLIISSLKRRMSESVLCDLLNEDVIQLKCALCIMNLHFNFNMNNKKNKGSTKKTWEACIYMCVYMYT